MKFRMSAAAGLRYCDNQGCSLKGTHMKNFNKTIAAASLLLAAFGPIGVSAALAQGDEATSEDAVEAADDAAEVEACEDDMDCAAVEEAEPAEADTTVEQEAPAADAPAEAEAAPAAGGEVVVVPGSTEESQPGGSTRPGTTPDT
jgi:hypothetical protein